MLVCHIISGLADGGAEAVLYSLCTFPLESWRHLVVALGPEEKYAPMLRAAGVETVCLGWARGRVSLGAMASLVRLLRARRPDVVQTWMYHANLAGGVAARVTGVPRVVWGLHHTHLTVGTSAARTRLVNWVCARLSSVVPSGIVACAEQVRLTHEGYGYARHKLVVVTNGCDTDQFQPSSGARDGVRRALGIDARAPVIGFVGRWHADKDHGNLIAAFAQVRERVVEARLLLVGMGCVRENRALEAQLQRHGLAGAVHPLGPRGDIAAVMNALDLHVLPSSSEAFPNVVAEAMACGTPCVVTDVGDAASIAGDLGWVVPPRDPAQLAAAITEALALRRDADSWQRRAAAGRRRVEERFSRQAMVAQYRDVWAAAGRTTR